MAFMRFMKRDKDLKLDDSFDIPPPPPPPSFDMQGSAPMPVASSSSVAIQREGTPQKSFSRYPQQENLLPADTEIKQGIDIPPISKHEENFFQGKGPYPSKPIVPRESNIPIFPSRDTFGFPPLTQQPSNEDLLRAKQIPEKKSHQLFQPETHYETKHVPRKQIFIEVTKYKQILRDLSNIKKSLKLSNTAVSALVGDIADEEQTFSKLHLDLSEIEQKLIELEDSIFTN